MVAAIFAFLAGICLGGALVFLYLRPRLGTPDQLKDAFSLLAAQALQSVHQQATNVAEQQLTGKQQLIDQRLTTIQAEVTTKLEKVTTMFTEIEKTRAATFATLTTQLGRNAEGLQSLQQTTADLKSALSNSRTRGQWGERMAEDVLKLAGLQPNIQYRKQAVLMSDSGARPRPDFSFLLPEGRVIHMDVKFPMDNYLAYLNADTDQARAISLKQFLSDVRARIREASNRDYRQASTGKGETTLDSILIFIPNEQIYSFLLEHDPDLLQNAVANKVIPCSPTTLLAVLAVIHQAAQHFQLEQKSAEIFSILKGIRNQWEMFAEVMDKMGKRIDDAQKAFAELTTTRSRMLDKQFTRLESLPQADEETTSPVTLISSRDAA